jgi:hypothetical protein
LVRGRKAAEYNAVNGPPAYYGGWGGVLFFVAGGNGEGKCEEQKEE